MSEETIQLTYDDALALVESMKLEGTEWRTWGKRSDAERLALGIVILQMHMKGKTMRDIEAELSIPLATCQRYKERALMAIANPTIDQARKEELARLEVIIGAVWPKVEIGDKDAIASYMKVSERRSKLLGLDSPIQVETTNVEVTAAERELQQMLAQQERDVKVRESQLEEDFANEQGN